LLWDVLGGLINNDRATAWCVMGDFHIICSMEERCSRLVGDQYEDFSHFNKFIEVNFLVDLPLYGCNFTWYCIDGMSTRRLDQ